MKKACLALKKRVLGAHEAVERGLKLTPQQTGRMRGKAMSKPLTKTQLVAALAEVMGSAKKTASAGGNPPAPHCAQGMLLYNVILKA